MTQPLKSLLKISLVAAALASTSAYADPITDLGSVITLEYDTSNVIDNGGGSFTYDLFLTIDSSGYSGNTADEIQAVAPKISNSGTGTLIAAPGNVSYWDELDGGANSSGCDGAGSGFICAEDNETLPNPAPIGGTYTWEFHYTTSDPLLLSSLGSSIKVEYFNNESFADQTSQPITLQTCTGEDCGGGGGGGGNVPEPGTLALLALGLIGASVARTRIARR